MFAGLPLGFSCARFGSLLSLLSFCFFCLFLLGLKGPYSCPVCSPVNIATIGISCFAVSFLCVLCARHDRILVRNDHLCPSDPHSRDPECPYILPFTFPPMNAHLGHPLPSPTHHARCDMLLLVLADVVMRCILCLPACFVCLPACFGLFPVCTCPNPHPEAVRPCCCHCVGF